MSRLPTQGGDSGSWGTVLNDYLTQNIPHHYTLSANANAGATSIVLDKSAAGMFAGGTWIAVGAMTTKCEVRRVTGVSSGTLTLDSALVYAHSSGEFAWVLSGTLVPLEWFGCKADDSSFDSYPGLQQAFNDIALKAGRGYGLTGHSSRYYTQTPLCVYDNTHLDRMTITAKSPMSIDLSLGNGRLGTADQFHITLGGQFVTVTSVDPSTDSITLSGTIGAAANDRVIFQPAVGSTLPGGIEAGRTYFVKTFPGGNVYTISKDYSGSTLDITSTGSGTFYAYSTGSARILWDFVTLEGAGITNLNGFHAALQQPAVGRNVRLRDYLGASGATTFYGQQAEFFELMITGSTIGLNLQGMQFLHVFGGNLESCGIGLRTLGLDPAGTATANRDIQLYGMHWESTTTKGLSLGDLTVQLGIHGGVNSGAADWLVVDSSQIVGYNVQNFSSITNSGNAIVDAVRGITLKWDDNVQDGCGGQIDYFDANSSHSNNPRKSWFVAGHSNGRHVAWESNAGEFRLNGTAPALRFGDTGPLVMSGSGTPEGTIAAPISSLFLRTDGGAGTSLYVKQSGTGNTGWVGK